MRSDRMGTGGIIECDLPVSGSIMVEIFNHFGHQVATIIREDLEAGTHIINWNPKDLPAGFYFYRLMVSGQRSSISGRIVKL